MSVSLLFCSLTLQALQFTFFFRLNAKYIPYLLTTPLPLCYTPERRPQSHWMARLNDWAADSSLWLSLKLLNENISCHINEQEMSPPSVISGPQMWMRAPQIVIQGVLLLPSPTPPVTAEGLGVQEARWARTQDWPRWLRSRERGGCSDPEAAPPQTQNARFLNLIPDLWCADCLLSVLQMCI